jgi:hypothetical protein
VKARARSSWSWTGPSPPPPRPSRPSYARSSPPASISSCGTIGTLPASSATPSASTSLTSWRTQLLALRQAVDQAKAVHAFGPTTTVDPLRSTLLWHFAYWRLAQLREAGCVDPRAILPPGRYAKVVVVMADVCAYSSYVRTRGTIASSASRSRALRRRRVTASSTTGACCTSSSGTRWWGSSESPRRRGTTRRKRSSVPEAS